MVVIQEVAPALEMLLIIVIMAGAVLTAIHHGIAALNRALLIPLPTALMMEEAGRVAVVDRLAAVVHQVRAHQVHIQEAEVIKA